MTTERATPQERFRAKTQEGPIPQHAPELGPCLDWTGATNGAAGYGQFHLDGRMVYAHRVAYTWENGPIPEGHRVDHRCHRHICVRGQHLRTVTQTGNGENRTGPNTGSRSRHRGVSWNKRAKRWQVTVKSASRTHHGGYFLDEDEAGEAARILRLSLHTHNDTDRRNR